MRHVLNILATATAISVGLFVLAGFFVPALQGFRAVFVEWTVIIVAFTLILGAANVLIVHLKKIVERRSGWLYSIVLIVAMTAVLVPGLIQGPEGQVVSWIFESVQFPLQATIFSLLAFFIASAAYRAFQLRSRESALLLIFGILVLLGHIPFNPLLTGVKNWIMNVPVLAGARGIILGVALGTVTTGLRLLLGIDRPYRE